MASWQRRYHNQLHEVFKRSQYDLKMAKLAVNMQIGDNTNKNADYKLRKATFLTSYVMRKAIDVDELNAYYVRYQDS